MATSAFSQRDRRAGPETLRQMIGALIERLSAPEQRVLEVAAIAGSEVRGGDQCHPRRIWTPACSTSAATRWRDGITSCGSRAPWSCRTRRWSSATSSCTLSTGRCSTSGRRAGAEGDAAPPRRPPYGGALLRQLSTRSRPSWPGAPPTSCCCRRVSYWTFITTSPAEFRSTVPMPRPSRPR